MTVKELIEATQKEVEKSPDVLDYLVTTEGFTVGIDDVEVDDGLKQICLI